MLLAADNLHALNPRVREAMDRLDPGPVREIAHRCRRAGARCIDVNPGYLSRRREDRMTFLVETVQEAVDVRLMLDSPHPRILEKGLQACRHPPILNAATAEQPRLRDTLALAAEHGTDLVVLLLDDHALPPIRADEKIALALGIRERALEAGLTDGRLIFDPVLPNLSWHDAYQRLGEGIRTVQMLASGVVLGEPGRTVAGLSNLRSGVRERFEAGVEHACLHLLAGAGLEMILADALSPETVEAWRQTERILGQA